MSSVMTLTQFNKWIEEFAHVGRYGWMPEHKKIGAYLKREHRERLQGGKSPTGQSWAKTWVKPKAAKGDEAMMITSSGKVIKRVISTRRGKSAALKYRRKHGPNLKPLKALYRSRGKNKAKKIYDFLVTNAGSWKRTGALRTSKTHMEYGYTPGTSWVEKLQYGGSYQGGAVPPREMVGLNEKNIKQIENIYADGYVKRALKGR